MKNSESKEGIPMKKPLSRKHLLGYAFGDWGECMTFSIMCSFLTRYYVNVTLMDTAVLAVMTLIWKIWDAICNPVMGMLMDKSFAKSKDPRGRFRPWMLRATPLLAITGILVFTAPNLVDGASRLVVVFVTYLLYEMMYTMFNIPYGTLLSAMAENPQERAKLSSARGIGGLLGSSIPVILFPIIMDVFRDDLALGYAGGVTLCAVIGFVCCLLSYRFTEERVSAGQETGGGEIRGTDILVTIRKNRAFVGLCVHGLCQCAVQSVSTSLGAYMYSDVLGSIAMMSVSSVLAMPVSLFFLTLAPKLSEKMGMEQMIRGGLLISIGLYVVLFGLHVATEVNVWIHMLVSTLANGFWSLGTLMQWGLVGDAIEYNEYVTGKRTEGSIYGTFNMVRRLGQALGNSFCVAALGWIGYNAVTANAGLPQSEGTILGIKALCLLAPALFSLGSWIAFKFIWNIDSDVRQKIAAAKAERS